MDLRVWPDWIERGILPNDDFAISSHQVAAIVHFKIPVLNVKVCKFTLREVEDVDDPEVTPQPSKPSGLYVLLDSCPKNEYRKRREGLRHSGYIFGRGSLADIPFDGKLKDLSRNHLLLRLYRGVWILENLSTPVGVNQVNLGQGAVFALNPQEPNTVRCPGDITFHIYCCDPRRLEYREQLHDTADFPLMNTLDLESSISSTRRTFSQTISSNLHQSPTLYIFRDKSLPLNHPDSEDSFTSKGGAAQTSNSINETNSSTSQELCTRLSVADVAQEHERIIRNSSILEIDGNLMAVNPWRHVVSLRLEMQWARDFEESDREIYRSAIALLHGGLSLLGFLHEHGIAHQDISPDTILVTSYQPSSDDVFLSGFSECKPVKTKAQKRAYSEDCVALFRSVREFLHSHNRPHLLSRIHWLEHPALQDAWQVSERPEGRSSSALDLCAQLGLAHDHNSAPWKIVTLSVCVDVEIRQDNGDRLLKYIDMTKLVHTEVRSRKISVEDRAWVISCMKTYFTAHEYEGFFPERDFWKFNQRVQDGITSSWGLGLTLSLATESPNQPDHIWVNHLIRIPCYRPSRMFNLSELLRICEPDNLGNLQSMYYAMKGCQDIRGIDQLQGIYIPFDELELMAPELQIDMSDIQRQINPYTGNPLDLEIYSIENWIMLAFGENSYLIPLERDARRVVYDGRTIALGPFLQKYGPKMALNILSHTTLSTPKFYKIPLPPSVSGKSVLYEDTAESQQSVSFKFRSRSTKSSDVKQRTAEWLGASTASRVNEKKVKLTLA